MGVLYEKKGKIAFITISRPEALNAVDVQTNDELREAWRDFRDDPGVWVAVLTGAGPKAFSTGADLKAFIPHQNSLSNIERKEMLDRELGSFGAITRNFNCWKPIIAAVNGLCLGGGLEMALACDIRIASENASFGLTEPRWGIIPGGGGTQRLPRLIPLSIALEMLLTTRVIDAWEALRIGLVSKVVPPGQLLAEAVSTADFICSNGPLAVRAVKEAVLRGVNMTLEDGLRFEASLREYVRYTEDAQEGPKAFAEKRRPVFRAR